MLSTASVADSVDPSTSSMPSANSVAPAAPSAAAGAISPIAIFARVVLSAVRPSSVAIGSSAVRSPGICAMTSSAVNPYSFAESTAAPNVSAR